MIKRYLEFINENKSLGEWVVSLYKDDYIKNIVNRFIKDVDPTIDLDNAINMLSDFDKKELKQLIDKYHNGEIEGLNENDENLTGKGIFTSFMKALTALGLKDIKANGIENPADYLLYHVYKNINADDIRSIFGRFKSLSREIQNDKNELDIYFGVKTNGMFEYGLSDGDPKPFGRFKLTPTILKWLVNLDLKSASFLKVELVNLSIKDIILMGKIKEAMFNYNPGKYDIRKNSIDGKILTFSYSGLINPIETIKQEFTDWCLKQKWNNNILISTKTENQNVVFKIKIK